MELKDLLERWAMHQHCCEFEESDEIEEILKKDFSIDMKKDWCKYLEEYGIIERNNNAK